MAINFLSTISFHSIPFADRSIWVVRSHLIEGHSFSYTHQDAAAYSDRASPPPPIRLTHRLCQCSPTDCSSQTCGSCGSRPIICQLNYEMGAAEFILHPPWSRYVLLYDSVPGFNADISACILVLIFFVMKYWRNHKSKKTAKTTAAQDRAAEQKAAEEHAAGQEKLLDRFFNWAISPYTRKP